MTPEQDKVLARVKKMLALANDAGASEGERDNALRMTHNLLAKHNLTMAQAEQVGQTIERLRDLFEAKPKWARRCAHGVAILFFCKYYFEKSGNGIFRHYFIGQPANVATCIAIAQYVIDSISREVVSRQKLDKLDGILGDATIGVDIGWKNSFADGAALAVFEKCKKLRAEAEQTQAEPGTSIVLASFYKREELANAAHLAAMGINLTRVAINTNMGRGFHAGKEYGNSINLNRQVGSNADVVKRLK